MRALSADRERAARASEGARTRPMEAEGFRGGGNRLSVAGISALAIRGWSAVALVLIILVLESLNGATLSRTNWVSTSVAGTEILLLALGQTYVIISGGIDLSDGAVLALSGMIAGWVMQAMTGVTGPLLIIAAGITCGILAGGTAGLVNGVLIARLGLSPFIVTLGTLGVCTGLADVISGGTELTQMPQSISSLGNGVLLGWFPVVVIITVAMAVIMSWVLRKTTFGLRTYAVGSNPTAPIRAGIRMSRHLVMIYTVSGLTAGVSGVLLVARYVTASPQSGVNDELSAIAAVIIGGASLTGGTGSIGGTVIGAAIISVLATGLVLVNVQSYWQIVFVGVIIVIAVYVQRVGRGRIAQLQERR